MKSPSQPQTDQGTTARTSLLAPAEIEHLIEERAAPLRDELEELRRENKKMQVALRESENHLKLTLDAAAAGMWISGRDGSWMATPQLNRIFGLSPDITFHREQDLMDYIHPEDLQQLIDAWMGSLRDGTRLDHEYRIIWPDGSIHWLAAKGRVCSESGIPRFVGITYDITERKRMEEALRQRLETERALINSSAEIAVLLDIDGIILNINDNYAMMLGKRYEELLGVRIWDFIPHEHVSRRKSWFDQAIRSKRTVKFEENRDGKWHDIIINPVLSADGTVIGVAVSAYDLTERKLAEQQLREYSESLKRSNEDLELFVGIATHDLQEPVRGIVIFSQLLLNQCREGRWQDPGKYLKVIEQSGLQMSSLVNDLREYSRVRTHAKQMEPVDTTTILSLALNNLHHVIEENHATVTYDPLPVVLGDGTQVAQVFQNLIDNAIKFSREEKTPEIHLSATLSDGMWEFAFRDNGIGIPQKYFSKIFMLFERLHDRDVYPGTGLGLALCKRIIERHGGRMWVDSEVGVGSTFFFTLPALPS